MPRARATLIAPLAGALVEEAGARGASMSELLRILGVAAADLGKAEKRIPVDRVFSAWDFAMRAVRDAALPVAVGKRASVGRFGVLGYAFYTSATLRDALQCAARYHDLINDSGHWDVATTTEGAVVSWRRQTDLTLGERVANEQAIASFATILREIAGEEAPILEVNLPSPKPSRTAAHEQHFRAPIRWNADAWTLRLPTALLEQKPKGADRLLTGYFVEQTRAALAAVTLPDSWSRNVATTVAELLPGGIPTLTRVAERLGTSERTARRRLREEDTTFDAIVAEVQHERARHLLASGGTVRDAAFATGFSDPSAFSRAYRRWTGSAPSGAPRRRGARSRAAAS